MNIDTPLFITKYVYGVQYEDFIRKQNQWIK
jgi:hypothetical protein